jgi:hypothetical protein
MLGDILMSINAIQDWAFPCDVDHLVPPHAHSIIVSSHFSPVMVSMMNIMMVHVGGTDFIHSH